MVGAAAVAAEGVVVPILHLPMGVIPAVRVVPVALLRLTARQLPRVAVIPLWWVLGGRLQFLGTRNNEQPRT
jgi:hypothetical protein